MTQFEFSTDVLIAGGGACGSVAALAARDAGAEVLVIERDAVPRGSTAMSQGLILAAGTQAQSEHAIADSADQLFADIMAKTRGQTDQVVARMIADGAGPCLDWLITTHGLPWTLDTGFRPAYGNSAFRVHGWPGHGGADMIGLLHQKLADAGADVLTSARLVDITADEDGRVLGVTIERPDGERERVGCKALVLATGGFAANAEMVRHYMPEAAAAHLHAHEGNIGEGIMMGAALGGALADMGSYQGYAMLTDPQGITVPPGIIVEGGIIVNSRGERFVNEVEDIGGMVHPVMAQPDGKAWVIFDEAIEARCAYIPETRALIDLNAVKRADDAGGLAVAIGVDGAALTAAIEGAHQAKATNMSDPFGREWNADAPPSGRLCALRVRGALYHTQGGLQTDGSARVLRSDGSAFPNLFAGGGTARGVSGPSSWGYLPAMGLCAAVTTGRIAGQAAAALLSSAGNSR